MIPRSCTFGFLRSTHNAAWPLDRAKDHYLDFSCRMHRSRPACDRHPWCVLADDGARLLTQRDSMRFQMSNEAEIRSLTPGTAQHQVDATRPSDCSFLLCRPSSLLAQKRDKRASCVNGPWEKKKGRLASATLPLPAAAPHSAGDCWTSAPGAYLPAASNSGTSANRMSRARPPNRRDGMNHRHRCGNDRRLDVARQTEAPHFAASIPALHVFHRRAKATRKLHRADHSSSIRRRFAWFQALKLRDSFQIARSTGGKICPT